jgi:hypothetical protein
MGDKREWGGEWNARATFFFFFFTKRGTISNPRVLSDMGLAILNKYFVML